MKIGIDGLLLTIPSPCGTRTYAEKLVLNLAKIDKKNDYFVFVCKDLVVEFPKQKNFHLIEVPRFLPLFKRQIIQPLIVKKFKTDLFHYLEPYGSVFHKHPKIITTVHDYSLGHTYPFLTDPLKRIIAHILRYFTFKKTKVFLVDSKNIKGEILKLANPRRVNQIYLGVDKSFMTLKSFKKINKKFFLAMGDFAPRKNIKRVIDAYKMLPKQTQRLHALKIVASTHNVAINLKMEIQKKGMENNISVIEKITNDQLIILYNKALCFFYPSLYEGFGLPILEAMVCGCPVITSNYGAMKEVAGDAALLVNPKSAKDISASIIRIIRYKGLRNKLIRKGFNRVKKFTWEKTARETLEVYKSTYAQK